MKANKYIKKNWRRKSKERVKIDFTVENSETYMLIGEEAIKSWTIHATELSQAQELGVQGIYGSQGGVQKWKQDSWLKVCIEALPSPLPGPGKWKHTLWRSLSLGRQRSKQTKVNEIGGDVAMDRAETVVKDQYLLIR